MDVVGSLCLVLSVAGVGAVKPPPRAPRGVPRARISVFETFARRAGGVGSSDRDLRASGKDLDLL